MLNSLKLLTKLVLFIIAIFTLQSLATNPSPPAKTVGLDSLADLIGQDRPWEQEDFDRALGGLLRQASGADIAVFEKLSLDAPVIGQVSASIAQARLERPGVLSIVEINGRQLKKILKLSAKNILAKQLLFFGVDSQGRQVHERMLNDDEKYSLALSEVALLELFGVAIRGGLSEELAMRAPFVESIYGNINGLFFISGPKTMLSDDNLKNIEDALSKIIVGESINSLVISQLNISTREQLSSYLEKPAGEAAHALVFNIDYLDLGLSQNQANKTYENYYKSKSLPMGRGGVDLYTHFILLSKFSLTYDAPKLITTLSNNTKYMTVEGFDQKPIRDKTTIGLDFRMPWERTYFKNNNIILSPILKNLYETKLGPIGIFSSKSEADWIKDKILPRTSKLDNLLGINLNFTKLGFDVDLGGVMSSDFNNNNFADAVSFGPGINFSSKWSLFGPLELSSVIKSSYLFSLANNQATNKAALDIEGQVWLRIARFHDFSISLMSDFLIASLEQKPEDIALSSIWGFTISYGRLFRLFG